MRSGYNPRNLKVPLSPAVSSKNNGVPTTFEDPNNIAGGNAIETVQNLGKLKTAFSDAEQEADHKIEALVKWFEMRDIEYPKHKNGLGLLDTAAESVKDLMSSKYGADLTKKNDYIRTLEDRKAEVLQKYPDINNRKASPREVEIYSGYKKDQPTQSRNRGSYNFKPSEYKPRELSGRTDTLSELDSLFGKTAISEKKPPPKMREQPVRGFGKYKLASSMVGSGDAEMLDSGGVCEYPETVGWEISVNQIGYGDRSSDASRFSDASRTVGGNPLAVLQAAPEIISSVGDAGSKLSESIGNQIDQARRTLFEIEKQNGELENMLTRKRSERAEDIDAELDKKIHERWHKFAKFSPPALALPRFGLTQDDLYKYEHNQPLGALGKEKIARANDALYQYLLKKRRLNDNFETPEEVNRQRALELKLNAAQAQLEGLQSKADELGMSGFGSHDDTDETPDGKLNRAYMQKLFNIMQQKRHELGSKFPIEKLRLDQFGMFDPNDVNDPSKRRLLTKADEALTRHILKKHGSGAYAKKHKNGYGDKHVFRGCGEPWYAEEVHTQHELEHLYPNPDANMQAW